MCFVSALARSQGLNSFSVLFLSFYNLLSLVATDLELVSQELNHLAAILQVYAGVYEVKKKYYFSKRKWKYFYTFNHFYSEKSSKRAK